MNIDVQLQIAKSRLALNKNAEHDQKTHGNRNGSGSVNSTSRFAQDALDASNSADEADKMVQEFDALYERYRGNTQQSREFFRVREAADRAKNYFDRSAKAFNEGKEMLGEDLMDKGERWLDEAEQSARSLGYKY